MTVVIFKNAGLSPEELDIVLGEDWLRVKQTDNMKEAIDMLLDTCSREQEPKLAILLSDQSLHEVGHQLIRQLDETKVLRTVPLVVVIDDEESYDRLRKEYSGSLYWLHKPFRMISLTSILNSALEDYLQRKKLRHEVKSRESVIGYIQKGTFRLKNFPDAEKTATMLSLSCPEPDRIALGLFELLANAIEHGNLGITFDEKRRFLETGTYREELDRRMALPENRDKFVEVEFELTNNEVVFRITDQGNGFDVENYISAKIEPTPLPLGRGIALARETSFDTLEYLGKGNIVRATARF
ncbi:ATP-binding protein [Emcibacter nanhaiensis]|uniref:ATP-binding protein n=1 Tax=Emcibacter nanhaiensis TaxID=1505037 RepID=A0A501PH58_9PROT|nr:ATP-binding protein [Emcibacter nanhaiensis]TPD59196.1 ATP-binding protein [Emcibacter nanhaiensis]